MLQAGENRELYRLEISGGDNVRKQRSLNTNKKFQEPSVAVVPRQRKRESQRKPFLFVLLCFVFATTRGV